MTPTKERVESQNQFNAAANVATKQLRRVLVAWIGRKAWRISGNGGAVAKLAAELKDLSDAAGWNEQGQPFVCVLCRHGCLQAFLRGTFAGCQLSSDLYLGRVDDDGILTRLDEIERLRTNYTVAEVKTATERAYELESEARILRRSVAVFSHR